jgi:hypothetical protein
MTYDELMKSTKRPQQDLAKAIHQGKNIFAYHTDLDPKQMHYVLQSEEKWNETYNEVTELEKTFKNYLRCPYGILGGVLWAFADQTDAMLFKLTWC